MTTPENTTHGDQPLEQWEHMVLRSQGGVDPQFVTVPRIHSDDSFGNAQPGWDGVFTVLNWLGAEGWQLVNVEGVSDDGRTGRWWLKRRAKLARVARR